MRSATTLPTGRTAAVFDLSAFIHDFMLRVHQDAAQALAALPADQDAGVIVTPVIVIEGHADIELEPMGFYRPKAEAAHG